MYLWNIELLKLYILNIVVYALVYYVLDKMDERHFNHQLTIVDSIYLSTINISTVGYGDILPKSQLSKVLVISQILSLLAIISITTSINKK